MFLTDTMNLALSPGILHFVSEVMAVIKLGKCTHVSTVLCVFEQWDLFLCKGCLGFLKDRQVSSENVHHRALCSDFLVALWEEVLWFMDPKNNFLKSKLKETCLFVKSVCDLPFLKPESSPWIWQWHSSICPRLPSRHWLWEPF